jgi:hypothetical protein
LVIMSRTNCHGYCHIRGGIGLKFIHDSICDSRFKPSLTQQLSQRPPC